jgi:hypothetical protein
MSNATLQMAYERIKMFLGELDIAAEPEPSDAEEPAEGPDGRPE